jgi:hypothetical protein
VPAERRPGGERLAAGRFGAGVAGELALVGVVEDDEGPSSRRAWTLLRGHYFLQLEGGALHLLECRGCREQRTLARRFHLDVVRAHLEENERPGRCGKQPYVREGEHTHGVHRFRLECSGWYSTGKRTKDVTAFEVTALVRVFVDAVLAAQDGRPSPGPALGTRVTAAWRCR